MAAYRWKSFFEDEDDRKSLVDLASPRFAALPILSSPKMFSRKISKKTMRKRIFNDKFYRPSISTQDEATGIEDTGHWVYVDLLIRRAQRCLEAGVDMIVIDAEDICQHAESLRSDVIAKIIGRLGVEKTMFEACDAKTSEWFIRQCGPKISSSTLSEVHGGDLSRKIIEMIFKAGWTSSDNCPCTENILKVHNPQTSVAQFEEYREMAKIRALRLLQEHSREQNRCLVDGCRFCATTVAFPLGRSGILSICSMQRCNLCCILRHEFSSQKSVCWAYLLLQPVKRAYGSLEMDSGEEGRDKDKGLRKAFIVCWLIAGRVHEPMMENLQKMNLRRD
ncbi:hypothetical protein Cgig2_031394 [Carnegiea gigantea]|uniref:Uncharacterized protein n=1 Tax=Carnegiea gigantea TaxID=171969 RepID=A0A9Q1QD54_9CARY|nr:hypothetical protein Cgig2_031394 [Carnegiea gigantea]